MTPMEHHAICYIGADFSKKELADYFQSTNPDVHTEYYASFGINEARNLSRRAFTTPVQEEKQVFLVVTDAITHEAQNALLKLLEEPPAKSQFYLVIPKKGLLLPTLLSRLHVIEPELSLETSVNSTFDDFYNSTFSDRLSLVVKISKDKDVAVIEDIVLGAEEFVQKNKDDRLLRSVLLVREHLGVRGSSTKMLLEELALALPVK